MRSDHATSGIGLIKFIGMIVSMFIHNTCSQSAFLCPVTSVIYFPSGVKYINVGLERENEELLCTRIQFKVWSKIYRPSIIM